MKDFVLYPEALALRELGFDEPCFAFFQLEYAESKPTMVDDEHEYRTTGYRTCKNSEIPQHYTSAPTYSQAFRFFREKYNLTWEHQFDDSNISLYVGEIAYPDNNLDFFKIIEVEYGRYNKAYEEAELACLRKLIEIVKNKEKF